MAGLNAGLRAQGRIPGTRAGIKAYMGVMMDDPPLGPANPIACSPAAPNIACCCGKTMRICA